MDRSFKKVFFPKKSTSNSLENKYLNVIGIILQLYSEYLYIILTYTYVLVLHIGEKPLLCTNYQL